MITSGEGKYKVWLQQHQIGEDILYILGGGQRTHIGGIVLCEPAKPVQTIKLSTHYDHIVLQPIAEAACKKYNKKVVAIGGVHVDNATKNEIEILVQNCKELIKCI